MNEIDLKKEVSPVIATAQELIVKTSGQYQYAGEFLKHVKDAQKKVTEYFEDPKLKAYQLWKTICKKESDMMEPLKDAEKSIKSKMVGYQIEEEHKRKAEMARLQAIAEEQARKERERLLKQAEKLKTPELKEQRMAEAEMVEAPVIEVQPQTPTISGISTRKVWKADVIDKSALIKAAAGGDMNIMALLTVDQSALNRIAQATKGQLSYPGVKFYEEVIIASGGKS